MEPEERARAYREKQDHAALTAKELIEILSRLDPDTKIWSEVDGNKNPVTRESVYLKEDGPYKNTFWIFAEWV